MSQENQENKVMLVGENGENGENQNENYTKTNYTNHSNLTNYLNYTNITSLLGEPENKAESVYFLLYAEPKSDLKKILEVSGYSKNAFYNFKSRDSKIESHKVGNGNEVVYDICQEFREEIEFKIKKKKEVERAKIESLVHEKEVQESEEELLNHIYNPGISFDDSLNLFYI